MVRRRPVIGVCSSWSELNPCNAGLDRVAEAVKQGVIAAGGFPLTFPTISISEPFSRPSSMHLRNLMAMDVEQMLRASPLDAVVLLGGCDKTVPAQLMGAVSAGVPALVVTAGPRPVSQWAGKPLTIDELWPLIDQRRQGQLDDAGWARLEGCLNMGAGTCNVMGTAISMAVVAEVLGFALPGSSLPPAGSAERLGWAERTGARAVELAGQGTSAASLITASSLRNALRTVCAAGGSTNAVIHLAAIAGRVGLDLTADVIADWARGVPGLADVRPTGQYLLSDLEDAGGVPAIVRELGTLFDSSLPTATGRPWRDHVDSPAAYRSPALRERSETLSDSIAVVRGNLAPDGAVIKRSAASPDLLCHRGPALVFDGVEDLNERVDTDDLPVTPQTILVLRGEGPVGGPGMPEVGHLPIPRRLLEAGVRDMVRLSDARMSGTATGTVVLHIAPEAAVGGPLGLVRDGDMISLDVDAGRLDLLVDEDTLASRDPASSGREPPTRGYDHLYATHVLQAWQGCDFDFLRADRF
jgi:dihydroxy-acid dehydratase